MRNRYSSKENKGITTGLVMGITHELTFTQKPSIDKTVTLVIEQLCLIILIFLLLCHSIASDSRRFSKSLAQKPTDMTHLFSKNK
jgi:hypothetical protein